MVVNHATMTEEQYLALDLATEGKHEFVNGEAVAMAGASEAHSILQANILVALTNRLRGGPCRAHGSDLRVRLAETGMYAYPDVTVVCGKAEFAPTRSESLLNPRVIVEVLSEATANYDLGAKAAHYRRRVSVEAIVFVDSRRRHVELQSRNTDGTWTLAELAEGTVHLTPLSVQVPIDELYDGVPLS